ncbi:hypothetical protein FS837_002718 [Tulasnella sp. UAMH 9824]|nr:hypothetical protein FS837_002718 [Tulasnella sp. UAMH 9824]
MSSSQSPSSPVVLDDVSLNFDSQRLTGLATLRLYRYAVPISLDILLQVLSATQWLEELTLGGDASDEEPVAPGPQVTLGRLKELKLEDITNSYCAALLSSIYTPICSHVHVSDVWKEDADPLDPLIWQPRNAQTTALLGLQQKSDAHALRISILVSSSVVGVHVYEQESNGSRVFSFNRSRPLQLVKLLGHFFSVVPFCPPISLFISGDTSPGDSFDLKPWGPVLHSLQLSYPMACLRAKEQLAQFTAPPNASERGTSVSQVEGWMCPNLKYITLYIPGIETERDLHAATLLSLVKTRWSGTDDDPAPANQPAGFEIICTYSSYQKLFDVEIEVKKVVSSFGFRWTRG